MKQRGADASPQRHAALSLIALRTQNREWPRSPRILPLGVAVEVLTQRTNDLSESSPPPAAMRRNLIWLPPAGMPGSLRLAKRSIRGQGYARSSPRPNLPDESAPPLIISGEQHHVRVLDAIGGELSPVFEDDDLRVGER